MTAGAPTRHGFTRLLAVLFWACAGTLALAIAAGGSWALHNGYGDWHPMSDALTRVGTRELLDPPQRWQIFAYLPATAYLFAPFAALPMAMGFVANAIVMLLCAGVAGYYAARVYALPRAVAVGVFLSWPPVVYASAIMGQNASLGLVLTMLSIAGTAAKSPLLTALPIGLLLYKPTYALPLFAVLVIRKAWRECGIVGLCASVWYVLGVVATGNDWGWPSAWLRLILGYAPGDLAFNGPLAISATTTLLRLGVPVMVVGLLLLAVAALGYVTIARAQPVEAASGAMLLALAWSPHAWAYDAALALPMIAFALGRLGEPARTYVLFVSYALASGLFFSRVLGFDPLLVITVGGSGAWIFSTLRDRRRDRRGREPTPRCVMV